MAEVELPAVVARAEADAECVAPRDERRALLRRPRVRDGGVGDGPEGLEGVGRRTGGAGLLVVLVERPGRGDGRVDDAGRKAMVDGVEEAARTCRARE